MLVDAGPPEARVDRQLRRMGLRCARRARDLARAPRSRRRRPCRAAVGSTSARVIDPMQPGPGTRRAVAAARRPRAAASRSFPRGRGGRIALGRLRIRVLWPDHAGSPDEDPHLHGAVLLASYGSIDLLLTGDSESDVTRVAAAAAVEVLKVAHHGSSDPGLAEELRVLRPRVAVISVGAHNDYGHPRADTLAALEARPGLAVYRTDESGRIVLESDGRSLTVRTERRLYGRPDERATLAEARLPDLGQRPAEGRDGACSASARVSSPSRSRSSRRSRRAGPTSSRSATPAASSATRGSSSSTTSTGQKKDRAGPPTGGWKAADIEAVADLPRGAGARHRARARRARGEEGRALAKACAKAGDVLLYDVAKRGRVAWVAERFRQAGVKAEADACALLIEYVGEDDLHGLANEIEKIATWAHGEPVGVAEIEQLVAPLADVPSFALTDAWARSPPRAPARASRDDLRPLATSRAATRRRGSRRTLNGHLDAHAPAEALAARGCPPARRRRRSRCIRSTARRSTGRPRRSRTTSSRARRCGSPSSIWR